MRRRVAARISRELSPHKAPTAAATATSPANDLALTAYSKGLARDVGRHGIRVNVVFPGLIHTDALDTRLAAAATASDVTPEAILDQTIASLDIPLGRAGTPDDVAALIAFLASRDAAYLTGSQFTVDGGALPTV
jgi:NAD(P)-dependent dehydrogenase (short-subunit alcohol dehydrogenase family)